MFELNLSKQAQKFLKTLHPKHKDQFVKKLIDLRDQGFTHDTVTIKNTQWYRTDVGEYRIIYRIDREDIIIPIIGKRNDNDVYRKLSRLLL